MYLLLHHQQAIHQFEIQVQGFLYYMLVQQLLFFFQFHQQIQF